MANVTSTNTPIARCDRPECAGARLHGAHCLEHVNASELPALVAALRSGDRLDARDTAISSERLRAVLDLLRGDGKRSIPTLADFCGATFSDVADFRGVSFNAGARFAYATFADVADFRGAKFKASADFRGAAFNAEARFRRTRFGAGVNFRGATFRVTAGFEGAAVSGYAGFDGAAFGGYAGFAGAAFKGRPSRSGAAGFDWATFSGATGFAGATFNGDVRFTGATFERARQIGPFSATGCVVLDDCVFVERANIEAAAAVLSARATKFAAGVHLRVQRAEIALDDVDFARPSTLSAATTLREIPDPAPMCIVDDRRLEPEFGPRVITVRGANVAMLVVSNLDMGACRFFGAHGLESMRIEASCHWSDTPDHWRSHARDTIAEEHHWRSCRPVATRRVLGISRGSGADAEWNPAGTQAPSWLKERDGPRSLEPNQIAALYRALRKAREDNKDDAGAGDLYYGEMEMRRHSPHARRWWRGGARSRGENLVLTVYWVISGYGMRPARALTWLVMTLIVGAALLHWYGFHTHLSYGRSMLFALDTALSFLKSPDSSLSAGGHIVQITLRLLGPLFFGLALLAIRARVKR